MSPDVETAPREVLLRLSHLRKTYPGTIAVADVSFDLSAGEMVGLVGPNGAGKSTTIKMLAGVETPDRGSIEFEGEPVRSLARPDVGVVHQDLGLVPSLSVHENLRLGQPSVGRRGPLLDRRAEAAYCRRALQRLGLGVELDTLIEHLNPAERALVAIARATAHEVKLLIVDEATSTLAPSDASRVVEGLRQLAAGGVAILFVSHKLVELRQAVDRIVMIVDGLVAADVELAAGDSTTLSRLMMAPVDQRGEPTDSAGETRHPAPAAASVLSLDQVSAGGLHAVDLVVNPGDVIGITGLVGSGLYDLGSLAAGNLPAVGGIVTRRGTSGFLPPQRETQAVFRDLPVQTNLSLPSLRRFINPLRLVSSVKEQQASEALIKRLAVKPASGDSRMGSLSGGNQQKVLIGRLLMQDPELYVLCEPTRGVDVGTRREIYTLIRELRAGNAAVLVISTDIEDLLSCCRHVGVLAEGRLGALTPVEQLDITTLSEAV